jgi:hypothetical protein
MAGSGGPIYANPLSGHLEGIDTVIRSARPSPRNQNQPRNEAPVAGDRPRFRMRKQAAEAFEDADEL